MTSLFSKYIIKDKKEDVFHTSAYSKAQNGGSMGAASTETFAARQALERNRQHIANYHQSNLMGKNIVQGAPKPKTYTPPKGMGPTRPPKLP